MEKCLYYLPRSLIPVMQEQLLETFEAVTLIDENELRIIGLTLKITSHRLLLHSQQQHSWMLEGSNIQTLSLGESGFLWSKETYVKVLTKQAKKLKLVTERAKPAEISIRGMLGRQEWLVPLQKKEGHLYQGKLSQLGQENTQIQTGGSKVEQSFVNFNTLFQNIRDLKQIMDSMRISQTDSGSELTKMIKDIGFVSVISKEEAGSDYERRLAQDLYKVCETALFPKYGGMVSMLDLFYIYNKTRQTCLISPEELLAVCARFEQFGLKAKLTNYTGNIKIVESTSFDPDKDYELNYSRFFPDYSTGFTAEEVARRKGWPVVIVEINLNRAARQGKLAKADLIEGVKYYKNLFVALK